MKYIRLINLASVGIFGMILSASFCGSLRTRKKRWAIAVSMAVILAFQGIFYFRVDPDVVELVYPFITHFPLAVVLCVLNRKFLWPVISVLTAYLCCQLRRWLALLVITIFSGGAVMQNTVELVITLPLLWLLLRFISPSVQAVSHDTISLQCQYGMVPALYYGFDYLTRIYTNMLLEGVLVAVEFMPFVCSAAYLVFVFRTAAAERVRSELEQTQNSLNMQVTQAAREIEALRESQRKTSIYRHDLRHHMQYLSTCIENGLLDQAQGYIQEVYSEIRSNQITVFCKNEVANLIFSTFAERARDCGIPITIRADIPQTIPVSESDLCVLLSNALENALHACQKRNQRGLSGTIEVFVNEKSGKLFLQFTNSCDETIAFSRGIPLTDSPGHGFGVRSICAIVDRYGGICDFAVKDNRFILRVLI